MIIYFWFSVNSLECLLLWNEDHFTTLNRNKEGIRVACEDQKLRKKHPFVLLSLTYDICIICALFLKTGISNEQNDDHSPWKHDWAAGQASGPIALFWEWKIQTLPNKQDNIYCTPNLLCPQLLIAEPLNDALSFCSLRLLFPIYMETVTPPRKAYFSLPCPSLPRSSNRTEDLIINGLSALSDLNRVWATVKIIHFSGWVLLNREIF